MLRSCIFIRSLKCLVEDVQHCVAQIHNIRDGVLSVRAGVHNPLAVRNTQLLKVYSMVDPRVRALAYVIKVIASHNPRVNWVKRQPYTCAAILP
jgi:hypothetical protein